MSAFLYHHMQLIIEFNEINGFLNKTSLTKKRDHFSKQEKIKYNGTEVGDIFYMLWQQKQIMLILSMECCTYRPWQIGFI